MSPTDILGSESRQEFVPSEHDDIYRILTTELQVGILVQLPDSEIIFSNGRALELLGLTLEQLLGKTSLDPEWNVIHPDGTDFPGPTHPVPIAIQTRQAVCNVEMGVFRPTTGSRVWLLVNANPSLNDDGSLRYVICTFFDVSKKEPFRENSASAASNLNRAVFDSMDAEIAVLSKDGVIVSVNDSWRRFALENSLKSGEMSPYTDVGTNYLSVCKRSAACDDNDALSVCLGLEAVISGTEPRFSMEYPCHSSNEQRWFSMDVTPLGTLPLEGVVVVHTNITARKLAELALHAARDELFESQNIAGVGSWHWDPVSDKVVASAELLRIYGVATMPGWLTQRGTLFADEAWEQLNRAVENSMVTGAGYDLSLPLTRPDGVSIWIKACGEPVFNAAGVMVAFRGTVQDITEKRLAAQRLKDNEERLQYAIASTSDGIWDWNVVTGNVYRSNRYYEIFCKSPQDDTGGFEFFKNLVHPDDLAHVLRIVDAHLQGSMNPLEIEFRPAKSDVPNCWMSVRGKAVERDPNGRATRVVGIVRDITARKNSEIAQKEREQLLDRVLAGSKLGYWDLSLKKMDIQVSASLEAMLGYEPQQMKVSFDHWQDHIHPDDLQEVRHSIQQQIAGEPLSLMMEIRFKHKSGDWHWMQARGGVVSKSPDGHALKLSGTLTDITDQRSFEVAQRDAATVFSSSYEGIMVVDRSLDVMRVNPAFTRITGFTLDEAKGMPSTLLTSGRHDAYFYETMWKEVNDLGFWNGEVSDRRKNGELYTALLSISVVRDSANILQHYVCVFSDISKFKAHEDELDRVAHYDPLTGSPNRRLLEDRLGQAIHRADRSGHSLAVCYLDLDGFKDVNEHHGRSVGDSVLVVIASRLTKVLRSGDTLARLGGDEFILILSDIADARDCAQILERFMSAVGEPIDNGKTSICMTASAGVSLYPDDPGDADLLMRHADLAKLAAKDAGKNRYKFFDSENDRKAKHHHVYLMQLKAALEDREFVLYYQPKVNLNTGQVVGAEALIRWQSSEHGLIPPSDFLPHVYGSELEIPLGDWVIHEAIQQAAMWQRQGIDITVSANLSAHQLLDPYFVGKLASSLGLYPDFNPAHFELEILETAAIADIENAVQVINRCREIGVLFALDDFGTGYSSLTYLRKLPVQTLKIDQSFVRNMLDSEEDMDIVESVIRLGGTFERRIIAEGVETLGHGDVLLKMGCPLAQGYGISRPIPGPQLVRWLDLWKTDARWTSLSKVTRDHPTLRALV